MKREEILASKMTSWTSRFTLQTSHGLQTFAEGFRLSREAADKALEIDPDYALAQSALSSVAMYSDGDLITAARHLGTAAERRVGSCVNSNVAGNT